jgi:hypothetical protein
VCVCGDQLSTLSCLDFLTDKNLRDSSTETLQATNWDLPVGCQTLLKILID